MHERLQNDVNASAEPVKSLSEIKTFGRRSVLRAAQTDSPWPFFFFGSVVPLHGHLRIPPKYILNLLPKRQHTRSMNKPVSSNSFLNFADVFGNCISQRSIKQSNCIASTVPSFSPAF